MTGEADSTAETQALVRMGLTRSLNSLFVKVATAGLSYVMFVLLSRAMGATEYGLFAYGFALATLLSIGASMGQQIAILRFWPEDEGRGEPESARNDLRSGWALTLLAGLGLTIGLCLVAAIYGWLGPGLGAVAHLFAASLLILPMGAAEYGSSALRAQGSVWTALAPRDILWRLAVPLVVWALFLLGIGLSGPVALILTAFLLVLALVVQWQASHQRGYKNEIGFAGLPRYWRARGGASLWFLFSTVIDSATLNLDTVLVGLLLTAESAGLYFNAFKTAGLLTLFMFAINLVIGPIISRHYHGGEVRKVQVVVTFSAWAGFVFSVGVFVGYIFFGDFILSLFGERYAQGNMVLILLSVGLLADAATGPTRIVMMMTGHERQYAKMVGTISMIGFLVQLAVIPLFGILAAASVNAATRIVAQVSIAIWTRRNVGIGPSILGTFLPPIGGKASTGSQKGA